MDLKLNGKTAVVTGASKGIGLATVEALVAEGVAVVAAARTTTSALKDTSATIINTDLSVPEGPAALIAAAEAELGGIDILVNNVGGGDADESIPIRGGFLNFSEDVWQSMFNLNFFATMRATRAAMPGLLNRGGTVINVSSIGARMPNGGPVPYSAAKAALTSLSKALSEEFGPQGVKVKTVSPGPVRSAMWDSEDGYGAVMAKSLGISRAELIANLPAQMGMTTGRMIETSEVGAFIAFLASPLGDSIVGSDHVIDGGAVKFA